MKMKKFIKQIKSEHYEIPDVYNKVKDYAYQKQYDLEESSEVVNPKKAFPWKKLSISFASIIALLIPVTILLFSLPSNKSKDSASNGPISNVDFINKTESLNEPKKTININNQTFSYPQSIDVEPIVNRIYEHENLLYWVNNYEANACVDIYHIDKGVMEKVGQVVIGNALTTANISLFHIGNQLVVYYQDKTTSTSVYKINLYDESFKLEKQYVFYNHIASFNIDNNDVYIVLDDISNSSINFTTIDNKTITNTINLTNIFKINYVTYSSYSVIIKLDIKTGSYNNLQLANNPWHNIYYDNDYIYLLSQHYVEDKLDYQVNVYQINKNNLHLQGIISQYGYVSSGDVMISHNNYLYLCLQDYKEENKGLIVYEYHTSIYDNQQLILNRSLTLTPKNVAEKITFVLTDNQLEIKAEYYNKNIYVSKINIEKWISETSIEIPLEGVQTYEMKDYFLSFVQDNPKTTYDDTKFILVNKETNQRYYLNYSLYDYYVTNYNQRLLASLPSSIQQTIEKTVHLITDGSYEIRCDDQYIYLPVKLARYVKGYWITAVEYWIMQPVDNKLRIIDIVSNYQATTLSNDISRPTSDNFNTLYPYGIVACIYYKDGFYYTVSPNIVVSYIKNDKGKLEMFYFINK